MTTLDSYPNLKRFVIEIAANNGIINRLEPVEQMLSRAERAVFADGVDTVDVAALDMWLGSLPKEQFETFVDGEASEMAAIEQHAPTKSDRTGRVSGLLEDIYNEIAEFS